MQFIFQMDGLITRKPDATAQMPGMLCAIQVVAIDAG
jgi:hypothetical protein